MTREEAKRELFTREPDFLEKAKKKVNRHTTYICPNCGNGSGSSGDGIALDPTSKNKPRYKCFKCGLSEDIIGLWKIHTGQQDNAEAFNSLYKHYGLEVESRSTAREDFSPEYQNQPKNEQYTQTNIHNNTYTPTQPEAEPETDYIDFFLKANKNIENTTYHRGISLETLNRFKVGYVEAWKNPKKPNAPASPRLIIPTSKHSYFARDTREQQKQYEKINVGGTQIFNLKALKKAQKPIFVVEGAIDAMSIVDVGGEAIGLGGTSMVNSLLDHLKYQKPTQPLIIAMDNDKPGERASEELETGLEALEIPCHRHNPYGEHKDANEALNADREAFRAAVEVADSIESLVRAEYMKNSVANHLQEFWNGIAASVNTPYIPTGFPKLDSILDGGLYEGLYIVGAISSLGKTTLITQIADQIAEGKNAEAGNDVLIFSLEMARSEIMAKSISRLTYKDILENNGDISNAKTARGITTGSRYIKYSDDEIETINQAIRAYGEYADHIFISEGIGDIGADQIRATVKKHIEITGNKPVVIIDYLQILAPADIRATDKQNTDKAVLELKRISRDYKIPVIGISSFNRENYKAAVKMEAFKESGAIEYSSDVLIGLQFKGVGDNDFDVNKAKADNPREVELVILKNRNGATGKKVAFEYNPLFNHFTEKRANDENNADGWTKCESNYNKRKPKRGGKNKDRKSASEAFLEAVNEGNGKVELKRIADIMGVSPQEAEDKLKENGGYIIDNGTVEKDNFIPIEITDKDEPPF